MATRGALIRAQGIALKSLEESAAGIAAILNLEAPKIPVKIRRMDELAKTQLEIMAAFMSQVEQKLTELAGGVEADPGYEAMTVKDLKALLDDRGVDYSAATRKAELIDLITADDTARASGSEDGLV